MRLLARLRSPRDQAEAKPKHIEIWEHFIDVNRMLKRLAILSSVIAFVGVTAAAWFADAALNRPVVYYVDAEGHAAHGGRLADADQPREVEGRYVAKRFLKHKLAFHSLTIESDMAEAWNLMTDQLRDEQARELAEYERERGYSFVEYVKGQQIRTVLDFARIEVVNHNDKTFAVRLTGLARTWPLNRVGEAAGFEAREFDAQLTLLAVPRTELTPNGLLVSHEAIRFFEPQQQAQALEETVPAAGEPVPGP